MRLAGGRRRRRALVPASLPACLLSPLPLDPPARRAQKLTTPLPVLHISAALSKDRRRGGYFEAPLYANRKRTALRYVDRIALRAEEAPAKWVLRGAALLCSAD